MKFTLFFCVSLICLVDVQSGLLRDLVNTVTGEVKKVKEDIHEIIKDKVNTVKEDVHNIFTKDKCRKPSGNVVKDILGKIGDKAKKIKTTAKDILSIKKKDHGSSVENNCDESQSPPDFGGNNHNKTNIITPTEPTPTSNDNDNSGQNEDDDVKIDIRLGIPTPSTVESNKRSVNYDKDRAVFKDDDQVNLLRASISTRNIFTTEDNPQTATLDRNDYLIRPTFSLLPTTLNKSDITQNEEFKINDRDMLTAFTNANSDYLIRPVLPTRPTHHFELKNGNPFTNVNNKDGGNASYDKTAIESESADQYEHHSDLDEGASISIKDNITEKHINSSTTSTTPETVNMGDIIPMQSFKDDDNLNKTENLVTHNEVETNEHKPNTSQSQSDSNSSSEESKEDKKPDNTTNVNHPNISELDKESTIAFSTGDKDENDTISGNPKIDTTSVYKQHLASVERNSANNDERNLTHDESPKTAVNYTEHDSKSKPDGIKSRFGIEDKGNTLKKERTGDKNINFEPKNEDSITFNNDDEDDKSNVVFVSIEPVNPNSDNHVTKDSETVINFINDDEEDDNNTTSNKQTDLASAVKFEDDEFPRNTNEPETKNTNTVSEANPVSDNLSFIDNVPSNNSTEKTQCPESGCQGPEETKAKNATKPEVKVPSRDNFTGGCLAGTVRALDGSCQTEIL